MAFIFTAWNLECKVGLFNVIYLFFSRLLPADIRM